MKRRDFLQGAGAVAIWPLRWVPCFSDDQRQSPKVMTVTGEITADQLGKMLPHEHILVDFIGADQVSRERYDADDVFNIMLPYVKQAKARGLRDVRRLHAGLFGPRSKTAPKAFPSDRGEVPYEHRLLRGTRGKVPAGTCFPGVCRHVGQTLDRGMEGWDRRHGNPPWLHQDWCGCRPADGHQPKAGSSCRPLPFGNRADHRGPHRGREGGFGAD